MSLQSLVNQLVPFCEKYPINYVRSLMERSTEVKWLLLGLQVSPISNGPSVSILHHSDPKSRTSQVETRQRRDSLSEWVSSRFYTFRGSCTGLDTTHDSCQTAGSSQPRTEAPRSTDLLHHCRQHPQPLSVICVFAHRCVTLDTRFLYLSRVVSATPLDVHVTDPLRTGSFVV